MNMAVNKVIYGNQTLIDLSADTLVTADQLLLGIIAHKKDGRRITGSANAVNLNVVQTTKIPTGTAEENTIAVVSDAAMTGYVLSADAPEQATGFVWVQTGENAKSSFYADTGGLLKVSPQYVWQFENGTWLMKDAFIYQNGAWVQFSNKMLDYPFNYPFDFTGL